MDEGRKEGRKGLFSSSLLSPPAPRFFLDRQFNKRQLRSRVRVPGPPACFLSRVFRVIGNWKNYRIVNSIVVAHERVERKLRPRNTNFRTAFNLLSSFEFQLDLTSSSCNEKGKKKKKKKRTRFAFSITRKISSPFQSFPVVSRLTR